jgi:hypothetical protein
MNFNRRPVMKRAFALVSAVTAAAVVVTAGSATAMHAKRSRALHVTKECSQYHGRVGEFCTITSSNIPAIQPGMNVFYLATPGTGVLDSDIALSSGHGGAAVGHVVLDLNTAQGRVAFSAGTGRFAGFHADARVSVDSKGVWHWDGTYAFSRSEGDD